jgi:hypothetical protein
MYFCTSHVSLVFTCESESFRLIINNNILCNKVLDIITQTKAQELSKKQLSGEEASVLSAFESTGASAVSQTGRPTVQYSMFILSAGASAVSQTGRPTVQYSMFILCLFYVVCTEMHTSMLSEICMDRNSNDSQSGMYKSYY